MKIVLTLAMILSSAAAYAKSGTIAVAFPVKCAGQADGKKIEVNTNEDNTKLEIAVYPADRARNKFDGDELTVTKSLPMFPIASIEAARDDRPVDGALNQAYLTIRNEVLQPNGTTPSKLTLTSTFYDRRNGKEVKTSKVYQLGCVINATR